MWCSYKRFSVTAVGNKYTQMKSNASTGFKSMKDGATTKLKDLKTKYSKMD